MGMQPVGKRVTQKSIKNQNGANNRVSSQFPYSLEYDPVPPWCFLLLPHFPETVRSSGKALKQAFY